MEEKQYDNGEIIIVWKPAVCIHSKICWKGLPDVFKPFEKPWIHQHAEETQRIIDQIDQCPSKALSYIRKPKQV